MQLKGLNPKAPHYYPSRYIHTYTCYSPVPPRDIPIPCPPFPVPPCGMPVSYTPFPAPPRGPPATFASFTVPPRGTPVSFHSHPVPQRGMPVPFHPVPVPQRGMPVHYPPFPVPPRGMQTPFYRFPATRPCAYNKSKLLSVPKEETLKRKKKMNLLEFDTTGTAMEGRTSIMIKNIPTKLTRAMLIQMLDEHCAEQETQSEYDFVYLPIDFTTGCSKGYAFVNYTTPEAAQKSYQKFHNHKWNIFQSHKIAHVCYALFQGKEALMNRFKNTQFMCNSDEYLPAIFAPARNGTTCLTCPGVIGRIHNSLNTTEGKCKF